MDPQSPPLTGLDRLIRANPERRTRLHTARGELMGPSGWRDIPGSLVRRLRRLPEQRPWLVPGAVRWLEAVIEADWRVLELGSGVSTTWFSERTSQVLTLEDDPDWAERVRAQLSAARLENCDLRLVELAQFPSLIQELPPESFDLVVVDSNESTQMTRADCLIAARDRVKPGHWLIVDDSDRPAHRAADEHLRGWNVQRFVGMKTFPLMAVETSVYRRPTVEGSGPGR